MQWRRSLCALAAVLACASRARAESTAQLVGYERGRGAQSCPDEAQFREAIRSRLGRDPFVSEGQHAVRASLRQRGAWFELALDIDGASRAVRARRCEDAVRAASLTVSIALDPELALGIAPSRANTSAGTSATREPPPAMPPGVREGAADPTSAIDLERAPRVVLWDPEWRPAHEADLRVTEVAFSMGARVGLAPGLGQSLARPAFSLAIGRRWGSWLLSAETTADLPGAIDDRERQASVSATVWTGALSLCRFARGAIAPFVCARATGGVLIAQGRGYVTDATAVLPLALAGLRVGVDVALSRAWAVRFSLDGELAAVRPSLVVDGDRAALFESPLAVVSPAFAVRAWY